MIKMKASASFRPGRSQVTSRHLRLTGKPASASLSTDRDLVVTRLSDTSFCGPLAYPETLAWGFGQH